MIVYECSDHTHILSGQYSHDCIMNGYEFMMLLLTMLMKFVTTGVGNRSALLLLSPFQTKDVVLFGVFGCFFGWYLFRLIALK